jgi:hypothetical protein
VGELGNRKVTETKKERRNRLGKEENKHKLRQRMKKICMYSKLIFFVIMFPFDKKNKLKNVLNPSNSKLKPTRAEIKIKKNI